MSYDSATYLTQTSACEHFFRSLYLPLAQIAIPQPSPTNTSRLTRPGGLVQMCEYYFNFQSDSGCLTKDNALYKWGSSYRGATEASRDPRVGRKLKDMLHAAGLVDVQTKYIAIPIGGWSRG